MAPGGHQQKSTLAQALDTGDLTSNLAQTPDAEFIEFTAALTDQVSYDNFKLTDLEPEPTPVAEVVLFEEDFEDPDGTVIGWYGAKWAVTNGAAVRTGDDTGDLRAIMDAPGNITNGYVFSFDWRQDSTTFANH